MPAASSAAMSSDGMPRTRSIVIAPCAVCDQITSGTYRSGDPAQLRRSRLALPASRCRSSSAASVFSISATISRGRILSALGCARSTMAAMLSSSAMSPAIWLPMSGRNTFTTTSRPPGSVAACTCAMLADASGVVSKVSKASRMSRASSCSTRARARSPSNGATRSCSRVSSSAMSGGIRSRRVDRIWPNFTKIGPSSCSASRRRAPRGCAAISADARGTKGRASLSQRSTGVPSSRSSRR